MEVAQDNPKTWAVGASAMSAGGDKAGLAHLE
jgi:hypothetical protein